MIIINYKNIKKINFKFNNYKILLKKKKKKLN